MIFYILSFILLILLINYHWKRRHLYSLAWSMNGGYGLPIIGDTYKVMCKNEDILKNVLNRITNVYPSPIKFWFGSKFSVFFTEVKHVEKVLTSTKFIQKGDIYRFLQELTGEGLIGSSGAKWKRDYRLITPLLRNKQIQKYHPCMVEKIQKLVEALKNNVNKPKFEPKMYVAVCTSEIVFETIMGVKGRIQEDELKTLIQSMTDLYVYVHERLSKVWLQNDFIYTLFGYREKQQKAYRPIADFIYKAVNSAKIKHEREEYLDEENSDHSILNSLLHIRDKYPDFATDKQLVDHLSTFYTASEDTSTTITCFALKVLGMHREIQNKVYDELRDVFGSTPREVTIEDLSKLNYLKMCVDETLRLFPPGPILVRTAMEDYKIDKWVIPKGCMVFLSIFNLHRDPTLWERPNEFYPEHFLPEAVAKRNPYAFVPFSGGPRICTGKAFGYLELHTILATLLQHFEFISEGKLQDKELKTDVSIRFKDNDYSVRIIPRGLI